MGLVGVDGEGDHPGPEAVAKGFINQVSSGTFLLSIITGSHHQAGYLPFDDLVHTHIHTHSSPPFFSKSHISAPPQASHSSCPSSSTI